jgi:alpha/beta hydrolase fold
MMASEERHVLRGLGEIILASPRFATAPLIRRRHLRWGATDAEVAAPMPGDELVPRSSFTATRAITIDAPPEAVWPWLVQLGYRRAGWYTYDLFDNAGYPSADRILPQHQNLKVGDRVPMAKNVNETTAFWVVGMEPNHSMLWQKPNSTWAWKLDPLEGNRTRLITRLKALYTWRTSPGYALLSLILFEFGDFPMTRKLLLGVKRRAEQLVKDADRASNGTERSVPVFQTEETRAELMAIYDEALRQWPVPYETSFLPTRYGQTHVIASGDPASPPLVMTHPAAVGGFVWSSIIASLSERRRVYALDTIGDVGRSELADPDRYPKKGSDYSAWLDDVYEQLEITQADVVAGSMGGWIAMHHAIYAPSHVRRLVLLGPMGLSPWRANLAVLVPFAGMRCDRPTPSSSASSSAPWAGASASIASSAPGC